MMQSHQQESPVKGIPQPSSTIFKAMLWMKRVLNVAVVLSLIGIALTANGMNPGLIGYVALALCGVLALLNWSELPVLRKKLLARTGYGLARFRHCLTTYYLKGKAQRLRGHLRKLAQQREADDERRRKVEDWLTITRQDLLSDFEYYKKRAAFAARLLSDKNEIPAPQRNRASA